MDVVKQCKQFITVWFCYTSFFYTWLYLQESTIISKQYHIHLWKCFYALSLTILYNGYLLSLRIQTFLNTYILLLASPSAQIIYHYGIIPLITLNLMRFFQLLLMGQRYWPWYILLAHWFFVIWFLCHYIYDVIYTLHQSRQFIQFIYYYYQYFFVSSKEKENEDLFQYLKHHIIYDYHLLHLIKSYLPREITGHGWSRQVIYFMNEHIQKGNELFSTVNQYTYFYQNLPLPCGCDTNQIDMKFQKQNHEYEHMMDHMGKIIPFYIKILYNHYKSQHLLDPIEFQCFILLKHNIIPRIQQQVQLHPEFYNKLYINGDNSLINMIKNCYLLRYISGSELAEIQKLIHYYDHHTTFLYV